MTATKAWVLDKVYMLLSGKGSNGAFVIHGVFTSVEAAKSYSTRSLTWRDISNQTVVSISKDGDRWYSVREYLIKAQANDRH